MTNPTPKPAPLTSGQKQARRVARLDALAQSLGYHSWSELGTEALKGRTKISKKK